MLLFKRISLCKIVPKFSRNTSSNASNRADNLNSASEIRKNKKMPLIMGSFLLANAVLHSSFLIWYWKDKEGVKKWLNSLATDRSES